MGGVDHHAGGDKMGQIHFIDGPFCSFSTVGGGISMGAGMLVTKNLLPILPMILIVDPGVDAAEIIKITHSDLVRAKNAHPDVHPVADIVGQIRHGSAHELLLQRLQGG